MFESVAPGGAAAGGFVAGFASRHVAAADILARAFGAPGPFAATGVMPTPPVAPTRAESTSGPKHFRPADPDHNPTEGWDPFNAADPMEPVGIDPVAEAHATGFAEGMAAATAARESDMARDQAMLRHLADALGTATHVDRDAMAERLRHTVLTLVRQLVGEIGVSANHLIERIDQAADLLADGTESAILRMHAADVPLVDGKLPKAVIAIADPAIERGGFVLESASTVVEDGPSLWLDQLGSAIEQVPVPRPC
jgi:flagellar assembly protein FliH